MNKRGQVAIFVIIAVVLVGAILVAVAFRERIFTKSVPSELQPVFDYYTACIEQEMRGAIELAGLQGGRIELGIYEPGNDYAPFSTELQFLGTRVPYWSRVNARGNFVQDVPTRVEMANDMGGFVKDGLSRCDFSAFREQGFDVTLDVSDVDVSVEDSRVNVDVSSRLSVSKGDASVSQSSQSAVVESRLGAMHTQALSVYNNEQQELFLERYAVDVLRSYAPVDGVSVRCSPEIWRTADVVQNLTDALVANMGQIRFERTKRSGSEGYFTVTGVGDVPARIVYAGEWPHRIEITPASQTLMIAEPVGNEPGMGILGFCYAPYHFVYDINFPVMVQLYDGDEVFQFPLVVVVDDNVARASSGGGITLANDTDICSFKEGNVHVESYDNSLRAVEASVRYQCFEQVCDVGETEIRDGVASLDAALPVCVNGQLIAESEGYVRSSKLFSSNSETSAEFILEKSYPMRVNVKVDGRDIVLGSSAIVHFTSVDGTASALIPEQNSIELHEGYYNVSVFVYGNSSVTIPASSRQECVKVPSGGIAGLFGATRENCFDVTLPATNVDYALRGGGVGASYILASELEDGIINLYVASLLEPRSLEQLQTNFELFNSMDVEMDFG
ncbi:MAG: hypothetical protein AABX12_01455 [Nanoarchaeota archaeon]